MVGGVGTQHQVFGDAGWIFQGNDWLSDSVPDQVPRSPTFVARVGLSLAYGAGVVLLFGGCQYTGVPTCGPLSSSSDTWQFMNGYWGEVCSNCAPAARWDAALAYDQADSYFLMYGGCSATTVVCTGLTVRGDLWKYTPTSGWTALTSPTFPKRADASMAYDANPSDKKIILFGGLGSSCTGSICDDSWSYTASSGWVSLTVPGSLTARFGAAITYDATDSDIVLFGGQGPSRAIMADTWTYTGATGWTGPTSSAVPARFDGAMTFDSIDGYVVLFGGVGTTTGVPLNDTWKFVGGSWTQLFPRGHPLSRWGAGMAFDPYTAPGGITLMVGGSEGNETVGIGGAALGPLGLGQGDSWEFLGAPNPPSPSSPEWLEATLYV